MEDVRSSEVLEKEVLEDARRKAERILKNADKQIESLEKEWKGKKEAELSLLNAGAEAKKALQKKEMDASFPLETQRRKLKFFDGVFENFLLDFFKNLPAEDLIRVLAERGKRFAAFFADAGASRGDGDQIKVSYFGVTPETALRIISSLMGNGAPESRLPELVEGKGFQGLIFTSGAYRYRLTADEIVSELREYHRKPIMDALWKERN